jgi:RNA polymerase primary sigma factor
MIDDGYEQLSDDNQDYDEVETIDKVAARRLLSSEESEQYGRQLARIGEVSHRRPESIGLPEEIDGGLPTAGGEDITVIDSVSHASVTDGVTPSEAALEEEAEPESAPAAEPEEEEGNAAKTTDPARIYLRKMGAFSLLTREGEVELAKRMEDGERRVLQVVLNSTVAIGEILDLGDELRAGNIRVKDVVKDADEDDAEFDENWHVERVCKVMRHRGGPSAPPWQARSPPLVCAFQARLWVFAEYGTTHASEQVCARSGGTCFATPSPAIWSCEALRSKWCRNCSATRTS